MQSKYNYKDGPTFKVQRSPGKTRKRNGKWLIVKNKECMVKVIACWLLIFMLAPLCLSAQRDQPVRVHIEGVSGRELDNVRIALALPEGLVSGGVVNEKWLEHFEKQVPGKAAMALEPFGYYGAKVSVSSGIAGDGTYELNVVIDPGEPVRVAEVAVGIQGAGKNESKLEALVRAFPVTKGARLDEDVYEKAKNALRAKAVELGYLDADYVKHEIRIVKEEHSARVRLVLETGEKYYFGPITFSGALNYGPAFLGRFIDFKPGDVFSDQKIGESQKNLNNADRFRSVMIYADKDKAVDHAVPVEVRLEESKPKRLRMGVGFETDTGPRGTFKYEDVNFMKTSHKFESQFDISTPLLFAGARYTMPHPKDIRSFSAISVNLKREDYRNTPNYYGNGIPNYFSETAQAEYERARSYGKFGTGSIFLQLLRENSDVGDDHTNSFSVMPGIRLTAIHYDNMVRPRQGYRYLLEIKGTHQALGSTTGFLQVICDGGVVIPLPAGLSLLTRAKIGATAQNEKDTELPIALRFFAGGDKSVRGYAYRSLGPTDSEGNVIGGKNMFAGSIELEKAIGKDWGLAVFYDAGNAFNDFSQVELAQGAGIGGRYYSPIGPIRLDIARQIDQPRPDFRVHISIGFGL